MRLAESCCGPIGCDENRPVLGKNRRRLKNILTGLAQIIGNQEGIFQTPATSILQSNGLCGSPPDERIARMASLVRPAINGHVRMNKIMARMYAKAFHVLGCIIGEAWN